MNGLASLEKTLSRRDLSLPSPPKPVASYLPYRRSGNLIFTAGALPWIDGKLAFTGPIDKSRFEYGLQAAQWAFLNALSILLQAIFDIQGRRDPDAINGIVQITGYILSATDFYDQHLILNGASNLSVELLGERGRHARTALGVSSLPLHASAEISVIAEMNIKESVR